MFGQADLLTVAVINAGLEHFKRNPFQLEFVLGAFNNFPLCEVVGANHMKHCVDFITNNRIQVAPAYQLDTKRRPSIGVVYQGREGQQFMGDVGTIQAPIAKFKLPPRVYVQFDVITFGSDRSVLVVQAGVLEKIWPGLLLVNGQHTARIRGARTIEGGRSEIYLTEKLADDAPLRGWRAQSLEREKGIVAGASQDDITLMLTLTTTGDPSLHRLLALVVRAVLKRGRPLFDEYGLQVATFSYNPPMVTDPTEFEMESVFTIEAKYTDLWVEKEFDLMDDTDNIVLGVTAVPQPPTDGRGDVELE